MLSLLLVFSSVFVIGKFQYCGGCSDSPAKSWDQLRSTFSINIFKGYYSIPNTLADANSKKSWKQVLSCSDADSPGIVFAENGDISTMPFYNVDGTISGIIIGMITPGLSSMKAPFKRYTLQNGTIFWGIEAHFRNPEATCTSDMLNTQNKIGDRLWFRNGTQKDSFVKIPLIDNNSTQMNKNGWNHGKCFIAMGDHYWHGISSDMSCDEGYPIFLLYTRHKLIGWGVGMSHSDRPSLTSYRWEHPGGSDFKHFFQESNFPKCLLQQGTVSTQHIFMTNPIWNNCL